MKTFCLMAATFLYLQHFQLHAMNCREVLHKPPGFMGKKHTLNFTDNFCHPNGACKIDYNKMYGPDMPVEYKLPDGSSFTHKITVRSGTETYSLFKEKMVDQNEVMRAALQPLYLDAQTNGGKSIRLARIGLDPTKTKPTLVLQTGKIFSGVAEPSEHYNLDMKKVARINESINPGMENIDERGHAIMISSSVPGEPLMPSEIEMTYNYFIEYMEGQGITFPPANIHDYPGAVGIFKIVPDPRNPKEQLIIHYDPAQQ